MYLRFTTALRRFLQHSMTVDDARQIVLARLAAREETFLQIVARSIYGHAGSPYRALLRNARCELGDLRALVKQKGLEGTLKHLRNEGIYIAFEEFKGRRPIVRPGLELPVTPHDFDNPFLVAHFVAESGGSTGVRVRVPHDLDQYAAMSPLTLLSRAAFGSADAPLAIWRGLLPSGAGINNVLFASYYGQPPVKWFSPVRAFESKQAKYTLATYYFCALARVYGARIPFPEYVPFEEASKVARWAADTARQHGQSAISGTVSATLRVSMAAQEMGLDLKGVTFMSGGEPVTEAKARGIAQSGAQFIPQYSMSEAGRIGNGCANPVDCSDVHLASDAYAIVTHPTPVPGFDASVDAFQLTTLLPSAPKIMLNVETDDYGEMEERPCGCLWNQLGFTTHLRGIRSYRKLTGEGMTLIASDMIRILEQDLPTRFGGGALDYQLLEKENERGFTQLYLLIHPRVKIASEQAVLDAMLQALRETSAGADLARLIWKQAGSLKIERREPMVSGHGKVRSLHVGKSAE